jgi:hypothetical protein
MAVIGGRALAGRVSMRLGKFDPIQRVFHPKRLINIPSQSPLGARLRSYFSASSTCTNAFTNKARRGVHDLF